MLKLTVRTEASSVNGLALPAENVLEVNTWRDNAGAVCAFLSRSLSEVRICFPTFASYIFPLAESTQERAQVVIKHTPKATRAQVIDHFTRNVVPLLLQARGIQVLHGSAIRFNCGVLGLCGRSLSGKSTLAYAFARRGYELWADDSLLISATPKEVRTLKTAPVASRLRPDSLKYFGEVLKCFGEVDLGSLAPVCNDVELELSFSEIHEAPLKALCLIHRVSEKKPAVLSCKRITGHQAFIQLLHLANYYDLAESAEHRRISETCLSVACKVPVYECRYRDGFDFLEEVVDEIEGALARFE